MDARSTKVCVRRSPSAVDHVCVVRIVESGLLVLLVLRVVKDALLAVVLVATVCAVVAGIMVLLVFFGIFGALAFRIRMFISHLLLRNTHLQQARVQQVRRSRADCSDPLQPCTLGLRDLALRVLFQSVILPPHPIYNVCLHWPLGLSHRSLSSLRLFLFPRFIFSERLI